MKEPTRWLEDDQLPANLRGVLEAGSTPPAMSDHLHGELSRYATGLAFQGLTAKSAAGTLGSKALLSSGAIAKGLASLLLIGAAGTEGFFLVGQYREPAVTTPTALTKMSPVAPLAASSGEGFAPAATQGRMPEHEPITPAHSSERHGSLGTAKSVAAATSATAVESPSIADEARLLESARRALGSSPQKALEIADRHRRLHPSGQMAAERELIAVDALLRLGRRQDAMQRADTVLEQAPHSLYGRRLRQLIGSESP